MKHISWGIVGALVLIGGIWFFFGKSPTTTPIVTPNPSPSPTPNPGPTPSPTPKPNGYTMADVATHASASSCWTAIDGKVYDLTTWIDQHPGGTQAILSLCGTDGSAAFKYQHGGQARPAQELANFLIGNLS